MFRPRPRRIISHHMVKLKEEKFFVFEILLWCFLFYQKKKCAFYFKKNAQIIFKKMQFCVCFLKIFRPLKGDGMFYSK